MSAAALIYLALAAFSIGFTLAKDGQPRGDSYSFLWTSLFVSAEISLLGWGGFFAKATP